MAIIIVSGLFFSISGVTVLLWARKMMDRMNQFRIQQRYLNHRVNTRRHSGGGGAVRERERRECNDFKFYFIVGAYSRRRRGERRRTY